MEGWRHGSGPAQAGAVRDRQCKRTSVLLGAGKMVASAMIAAHGGWKGSHRGLLVKDILSIGVRQHMLPQERKKNETTSPSRSTRRCRDALCQKHQE